MEATTRAEPAWGVDSEYGRLMKQPDEIGGAETQAAYLVVSVLALGGPPG